MQRLYLSADYPEQFIYEYIPQVFIELVRKQLIKNKNSKMDKYLKKNYQLSILDINNYLDMLRVDKCKLGYIIHADIPYKTAQGYYVREIFHIISYGNLDIKGLHIIDGALDYIKCNINTLYRLYKFNYSRFNSRKS